MRNRYDEDEVLKQSFQWKHVKRLGAYLYPFRFKILVTLLVVLCSGMLASLGPYLVKTAIDHAIPDKDFRLISMLVGAVILVILMNIALFRIRVRYVTLIGQSVIRNIRRDLFVHLQKLPFRYYDERPHGKIIVRVVNYVNSISELLSQGIIDVLAELFVLLIVLIVMFSIHWKLTLICVAVTPFVFALVMYLRTKFRKALQRVSNKQSNMNAYIHESIKGLKVTQSFAREEENLEILKSLMNEYRDEFMASKRVKFLSTPVLDLAVTCTSAIILLFGYLWIGDESITIGILVAFMGYMGQFFGPMAKFSDFYAELSGAMAYLERIFEVMDEEPEIKDAADAIELPEVQGHVSFRKVSFAYEEPHKVLDQFNLDVRPGETVAIVGATGAGKSTIIHLLSRFYNLSSGSLSIDGYEISKVSIRSLRKQMGVMQQDTFIFNGSVMENIRYGKLEATDDEVIAAAKAVSAHDFIMSLEDGYHTQVRENGGRLSVGQKQLIGLARVFLADPKLIILDEATSSIDTETERRVQEGMNALFEGRTTFVIAHRLSTIRNADRIIYLDQGKIIEQGTHEELMKRKQAYYQLFMMQVKYLAIN